jgi:DNA-binding MarR family transcriptional regulator
MLFTNLASIAAFERSHLRFVRSREDWNILVAIGEAGERQTPIGFKQLVLQEVATPSTLTRKLKQLLSARVIRRVVQSGDGRMVAYTLTRSGLEAFRRYERFITALRWERNEAAGS